MTQNETGKMNSRQAGFVRALVQGRTISAAATSAGISRATAYRWLALPAVQAAIVACQDDSLRVAAARLGFMTGAAVDVVGAALVGGHTTIGQKWAAGMVVSHVGDLLTFVDLLPRLAALEERLKR